MMNKFGKGAPLARSLPYLPDWALLARHRKPWTRLQMFHWPASMASPATDNSLPERLAQTLGQMSRTLGPLLLLVATAGTFGLIARWLF